MPGKMARSDPRPSVRVTRGAGSGQHLASVLQEGRENANIDVGLGFIWRISVKIDLSGERRSLSAGRCADVPLPARVNPRLHRSSPTRPNCSNKSTKRSPRATRDKKT
jgi:hypothetical protein